MYVLTFHDDIRIDEKHFKPFSERCVSSAAADLIQEVCSNVTKHNAFGSLCKPLCLEKMIIINSCIHHGSTYVLIGQQNKDNIVIKKKKTHNLEDTRRSFEDFAERSTRIEHIREHYLERVSDEIRSRFGEDSMNLFHKNLFSVSLIIFGKNISTLTLPEMKSSWHLLGQDELAMLALYQNQNTFSKLKGTCGPMYAIEKLQPFSDYFPEVITSMSWYKRVKIAKSFLALLKDFQHSEIGPLYHCDIQEGNFGLTKDLKVKAIDVDLIYGQNRIDEILPQPQCTSDAECDFFDCHSKCDVKKGMCTKIQITNNFQVMCRDIFYPSFQLNGLLSSFQPAKVKRKLITLLQDCQSKEFGQFSMSHANVVHTMQALEDLLDESLQHNVRR